MRRAAGAVLLLVAAVAGRQAFAQNAQNDLSGGWSARYHEDFEHRIPGPELGDYTGLPINDAARLKADSWDASILTLREHQAKPHPSTYSLRGPANIRIRQVVDPITQRLTAYELFGTFGQATRLIWMDGRAHPSDFVPHTWAGFSTGRWDGGQLTVSTTHLKAGWLQRNGVAHSDRATMVEHFIRHGDYLTVVTVVDDPVYLDEPLIRTSNWVLDLGLEVGRTQFDVVDEVAGRPKGYVPHHLPGSPGARLKESEFASRHGIPPAAARGGAATTYPEYRPGSDSRAIEQVRSAADTLAASEPSAAELRLIPVQGGVYLLAGAGGNVTLQIGDEGVLVVDTGGGGLGSEMLAAIREVSDKPVRLVVNTHAHADHVGGNETLASAGKWAYGDAPGNFGIPGVEVTGPRIIAHESVLAAMSGRAPSAAWPTETFFGEDKEIFFNDEAIQLLHQPGHTDGDILVFFRRSDVVSAGDLFSTMTYPVIDLENGGSVQGAIDGLNRLLDLAIPRDKAEGGTYVIPGHGRVSDEADVVEYRDMLTIVRDRVQDLIEKGRTLEEVKAARPTLDYDGRYAADSDQGWTTDRFVEAVYRDLSGR